MIYRRSSFGQTLKSNLNSTACVFKPKTFPAHFPTKWNPWSLLSTRFCMLCEIKLCSPGYPSGCSGWRKPSVPLNYGELIAIPEIAILAGIFSRFPLRQASSTAFASLNVWTASVRGLRSLFKLFLCFGQGRVLRELAWRFSLIVCISF